MIRINFELPARLSFQFALSAMGASKFGTSAALVVTAYIVLRLIYFAARVLFRMEAKGTEVLTQFKPPYLICPNHQSYIDPFLVCSAYQRSVLENTCHVGASMYFTNNAMSKLGGLINVPIDPDAQLLNAMRAGAAGLRAGKILNIYPEGQRSFDGKLHEFKKGAAILGTELNLPIAGGSRRIVFGRESRGAFGLRT